MGDSGRESFGDEGPSCRELERLRRHLKLAQQHLDLAYQAEEGSPSRSSSPEVNTAAQTAAEQNRLNFAQEKQGEASEKGNDATRMPVTDQNMMHFKGSFMQQDFVFNYK